MGGAYALRRHSTDRGLCPKPVFHASYGGARHQDVGNCIRDEHRSLNARADRKGALFAGMNVIDSPTTLLAGTAAPWCKRTFSYSIKIQAALRMPKKLLVSYYDCSSLPRIALERNDRDAQEGPWC